MDNGVKEAIDYIHTLLAFGSRPGLDRMEALLTRLGEPQQALRFLHIAGTNGKGSVTASLAAIFRAAGIKVGHFTSPYVVDFRERIQVNGEMIPQKDLARLTTRVRKAIEELNQKGIIITEFECITALGFLYFLEQQCQVVVLETGLGGRFDATNVIPAPLCAVLTSISLDHCHILGDTVEQIAFEKCGIIKFGTQVVTVAGQDPAVLQVIRKTAAERGCVCLEPNLPTVVRADWLGTDLTYDGVSYHFPLAGPHQVQNLSAVFGAVSALRAQGWSISTEAVKQGLASVTMAGRCEVLRQDPPVVLDGGHNPDGAAALAATLPPQYRGEWTAVIGMMKDKDVSKCIQNIAPLCRKIYTVPVDNPRTMDATELATVCRAYCDDVKSKSSAMEGVIAAFIEKRPLLLCGSLYLCGEIREKVLKML